MMQPKASLQHGGLTQDAGKRLQGAEESHISKMQPGF
jgi:hypothetical protein